jgi:adenine-specific DNA-methyltransferase
MAHTPQNNISLFTGDNLASLNRHFHEQLESVDICYIDPPYNTGGNFIYNDNRGSHRAWTEFMRPRLAIARSTLKDTGIIAISIDDYEHAYLKVLMDDIFGESNFVGNIVTCRSKNGNGNSRHLAKNHEYILLYGKSKHAMLNGAFEKKNYSKRDKLGPYNLDGILRKKGDDRLRTDRPNLFYPLYANTQTSEVSTTPILNWVQVLPLDSKGVECRWTWSKETAARQIERLYAGPSGTIYIKSYQHQQRRTKIKSLWLDTVFYTEQATNEITEKFGAKVFDTPKPLALIKRILDTCARHDAVVLDFFAGSGVTACAAFELNAEDGGTRRCILMESDDPIPDNHIARQHGFKLISDITKATVSLLLARSD